jgi:glycosyltransferase involved in cell wall biosynthesis
MLGNQERPRILLAVTVDSSWILLRGFPEYLAEHGWDVHVLSSPGPELAALASHDGVTAHEVSMSRRPHPLHDLRSLGRLIRTVRRIKPAVANYGTPKAGLLVGLACALVRVPNRIYTLRGLRLETISGIPRGGLLLLERLLCTLSTAVLAVSDSLRNKAISLNIVAAQRIIVIGSGSSNGVDLDRFALPVQAGEHKAQLRTALGLRQDIPAVVFVGRLTIDKGLNILAAAAGLLHEEGLEFQLVIVGKIDDSTGKRCLELLTQSFPATIVTGEMSDVAAVLPACDILCLPTFREGFPNIVLEAAACSVPSVTTDATGAIDSVVDGVTGIIVPVGDAVRLAQALRDLLVDDARRALMGSQARLRAEEKFDRNEHWRRLESFYREKVS